MFQNTKSMMRVQVESGRQIRRCCSGRYLHHHVLDLEGWKDADYWQVYNGVHTLTHGDENLWSAPLNTKINHCRSSHTCLQQRTQTNKNTTRWCTAYVRHNQFAVHAVGELWLDFTAEGFRNTGMGGNICAAELSGCGIREYRSAQQFISVSSAALSHTLPIFPCLFPLC